MIHELRGKGSHGRPSGSLAVQREPIDRAAIEEAIKVVTCFYEDKTEWATGPDFDLLEKVHEAAEELQMLIDEKSYHLVSATAKQKHMDDAAHEEEEEHSNETPRLKQSHTFKNIDRHMPNMSMNLPWAGSCEEDALKMQLQWPSRLSFVGEAILNEREVRTYESASALSLANFTSLLFEFVARLQNLLNSFKELIEKAKFTDTKNPLEKEEGGFWTRLMGFNN
ncbi:hypothetical protein LXL04_034601 [Taraxacum kok-saghyz]